MTDEGRKLIEDRISQLESTVDSYRYRLNEAIEAVAKNHNSIKETRVLIEGLKPFLNNC